MLTVTYALVTLSVEQKKSRNILSTLQQQIQSCAEKRGPADRSFIESILYQLVQFDEACRWRNLELYVIPALSRATTEAQALIAELELLSSAGENILRSVRCRLWQAFEQGSDGLKDLCGAMDHYCHSLFQRLAKEEDELLPMAQRIISNDEWFDIAAQFISHDAETHAHKPVLPDARFAGRSLPTFATRVAKLYQVSG